jgi:nitrite reductase (NADH) large subunit
MDIPSHCPYCALQCGMTLKPAPDGPLPVEIGGRAGGTVNRGALCGKGATAAEPLIADGRLTAPLVRDAKDGPLREANWSEALDRAAAGLSRVRASSGPDAVGVFGSGALTNEKAYLLGKFARVALRTANIDYNGRFCMSAAAAATRRAFGLDRGLPFPVADIARTGAVLLVGANVAETMPPIVPYFQAMRDNGGTLITIDPRRTRTAELADLHLSPLPGSDLVLALGMLHVAYAEGLTDTTFIEERTVGFEAAAAIAERYPPQVAARMSGVPADEIRRAVRAFAAASDGMILTARGTEQHADGTDAVTAWINLALALGKAGRPLCGYGPLTGQGNGQGGREHGQKADQLAGYRPIADLAAREHIARVWGVPPESLPGPGMPAVELLTSERIRAMFVMGSNPVISAPNAARVERKLAELDFLVVADFLLSETAALADVVLPGAQWAEESGTTTNLEGRVLLRRQALTPPSGVRTDLEILSGLAARLGAPEGFPADPEQVFAELARASAGGPADYSGISYDLLATGRPVHWPCPGALGLSPGLAEPKASEGTPRLFLDRFATSDGKARFIAVDHQPTGEVPDEAYPYRLTTGRVASHYQSGTQTRRSPSLVTAEPEPYAQIHPQLAARLRVTEGAQLRLTSPRGQISVPAKITDATRPDTVFVPFHWPGDGRANTLTRDEVDPVSGMPDFKAAAVRVETIRPRRPQSRQETPMRRLILIGHGMVGHRFLERLVDNHALDSWQVTVLAEEPRPAYDRVHLTSLFAEVTAAQISLDPGGAFCAQHGIVLRLGSPVAGIDRGSRTVRTTSGETFGYDALVLATGSVPVVPPVPGRDLPGCFVYRTIEDVEAITAYANGRRTGIVVGGGLLGLEAAGALASLGLSASVVEFAPRLMPVQIDEGAGAMLRARVEELGVRVHAGTRTEEVLPAADGAVGAMRVQTADGPATLEADLVVFAAGIRPRDELARACGLRVGERGGIAVDESCRTDDASIYAIGECAQAADGKVYGLVAPGYRMAETAADAITGTGQPFLGADTSTKLKLLGVEVASFGDAFADTPSARTSVFADATTNVFKKLVLGPGGELLGGMLVGDASAYDRLKPLLGTELPHPPERYFFAGGADVALPDTAVVCSCHNVTQAAISSCTDLAEVKSRTKAGTGCGSCVPTVKAILAAAGGEADRGLCEHFEHTRAELVEIIRVRRITSFEKLLETHGSGAGCDICKPAVASIFASLNGGHILDPEQAALQDTNDHFLANLQRNGSYSVVPRIPGGEIAPEKLLVIAEVARDFGLYTKITGGQRIDLFGARVEQLPAIWRRLVDAGFESGHAYGKALRTVKSCVGSTWCRYGVQDSVRLAIDLELRYRGLRSPHKLKAAVSGCARECAEARSKDFGIIATSAGWNLYVGGNGGFSPRHADLLAEDLDEPTLIKVIDRFLMFYIRTAGRLERTAAWIERMDGGLEHLRAVLLDDSLGLCASLEEAMAAHIASYTDEWRGVLDDPDKLRRFVSFVNAPDVPDPSIRFETVRDQIKPLEVTLWKNAGLTSAVGTT